MNRVVAIALVLATAWLVWEIRSPARHAPAEITGPSRPAARVEGAPPRRPALPDEAAPAERDPVPAGEPAVLADAALAPIESGRDLAAAPRGGADVRPPPPPEAFAPQPRAPPRNRDTGLVFRDEPQGEPNGEAKQLRRSGPRALPGGAPPAVQRDLRPPPDPSAWAPAPPRVGPDPDTGLVFSHQPPPVTDASGGKR
jgi:hypothetical protein